MVILKIDYYIPGALPATIFAVQGSEAAADEVTKPFQGAGPEARFFRAMRKAIMTGQNQDWRVGKSRGWVWVTPQRVFGISSEGSPT